MSSGVAKGLLGGLWFLEEEICGKSDGLWRPFLDGQNDGAFEGKLAGTMLEAIELTIEDKVHIVEYKNVL